MKQGTHTKYGVNWDSKNQEYVGLKNLSTIDKAFKAQELKSNGMPVKEIAKALGKSKSRIYEYLKKVNNQMTELEIMADDYINSDKYR